MTATERLRQLLDERGVEWTYADGIVSFNDGKHWYHAWAYNDGAIVVSMGYLTPEQAVEATLGRETCKAVYSPNGVYCSACHGGGLTIPRRGVNALRNFCPNCGREVVE